MKNVNTLVKSTATVAKTVKPVVAKMVKPVVAAASRKTGDLQAVEKRLAIGKDAIRSLRSGLKDAVKATKTEWKAKIAKARAALKEVRADRKRLKVSAARKTAKKVVGKKVTATVKKTAVA